MRPDLTQHTEPVQVLDHGAVTFSATEIDALRKILILHGNAADALDELLEGRLSERELNEFRAKLRLS